MQGNVKIIKTSSGRNKTLFEERNMILDGMRKTIADAMTYKPNPSGAGIENGTSSVSSFQVQAFTLGSAKEYFHQRDSRFFYPYNSSATSSVNHQLLTPKDSDLFPLLDSWSSIGFNQWRYDSAESANILTNPTLKNEAEGWRVDTKVSGSTGVRRFDEVRAEGSVPVTRYEVVRGQQKVTLTQSADLALGRTYFAYNHVRAKDATFDFRVARGRNGQIVEYYDFTSGKFVSKALAKEGTRHTVTPSRYFEVEEFVFKLHGHLIDQGLEINNEYFVEYVFPAKSFRDTNFSPWNPAYQNPYVDVISLELLDQRNTILPNSNFLEHQSVLLNNNFTYTSKLTSVDAINPGDATAEGLVSINHWNVKNPILNSSNPSFEEDASGFAFVKPISTNDFSDKVFSSLDDGVVLYVSSSDIDSSGCGEIAQKLILSDELGRNEYAFTDSKQTNTTPELIDLGYGQRDNNKTFMLSFDAMVSGEAAAANCGHIEVRLTRDEDEFSYDFSNNSFTRRKNAFTSQDNPKVFTFDEKDAVKNFSVPVIFPADASRKGYTLSMRGRGRSDGTNGFVYYAITNLSFGPLGGWRTYAYDLSSIGSWSLSSTPRAGREEGLVFSALGFSGPRLDTLSNNGEYFTQVDDIRSSNKNQLVTNFVGLEPTKMYRLALKGVTDEYLPQFKVALRARRKAVFNNQQNIFGGWGTPVENSVPQFNPYSNSTAEDLEVKRRVYQSEVKSFEDPTTKPTDFSILLDSSGGSFNSVHQTTYANEGNYYLSLKVFNTSEHNSYFVLSGIANRIFNWELGRWENTPGIMPSYRSDTSGAYFLPLPSGRNTSDFTEFTAPSGIFMDPQILIRNADLDGGNFGLRGDFKIVAGLYGPNAAEGSTYIKDISLRGEKISPSDTIWNEKYYDFENGDWQFSYTTGDSSGTIAYDSGGTRNFIVTPSLIKNMCFHGLERDTEYQLNLIDVSGGQYDIHDISLVDTALICNKGRDRWIRDAGVFTSEAYDNEHRADYDDGLVIKTSSAIDFVTPSDIEQYRTPRLYCFDTLHGANDTTDSNTSRRPHFAASSVQSSRQAQQLFVRTFEPKKYGLKSGDSFAVGWTVANTTKSASLLGTATIEAQYQGQVYQYDFDKEEWSPGKTRREQQFTVRKATSFIGTGPTSSMTDVANETEYLSPSIKTPSFENAEIIVTLKMGAEGLTDKTHSAAYEFKLYRTTPRDGVYRESGNTFLFPEFPEPTDRTLQSRGLPGEPDELGHFLNRIPYFSSNIFSSTGFSSMEVRQGSLGNSFVSPAGERTFEQAVAMGAYLPSGGLFFGSGTFGDDTKSTGFLSGTLNTMGVVNSDGYIYKHPVKETNWLDASAGFVASAYVESEFASWTYKPQILRYVLRVHKDDWKFLDYYMGGVGAMGLNTIDYKKTYDKLGTAYQLSGTGAAYSQGSRVGLYNVSDPDRNPEFNLVAKKVMFPPGLHIDYDNTDYLTIIWDINFMS